MLRSQPLCPLPGFPTNNNKNVRVTELNLRSQCHTAARFHSYLEAILWDAQAVRFAVCSLTPDQLQKQVSPYEHAEWQQCTALSRLLYILHCTAGALWEAMPVQTRKTQLHGWRELKRWRAGRKPTGGTPMVCSVLSWIKNRHTHTHHGIALLCMVSTLLQTEKARGLIIQS